MYGSNKYGTTKYAQDLELIDGEIELNRPDLLSYLPPLLREVKEYKIWSNVVGYEIALLKWRREDVFKQCFIDTATWGLMLWEEEYEIPTDLNKSYEERREIIKAKKRGQGTVTKRMLKATAEAFSGGECEVIEHPESYSFEVQFIGVKGIPKNLGDFKDMLETIKPAHLAYDFKYTYTIWELLKERNLSWSNIKIKTWNNLKVYE